MFIYCSANNEELLNRFSTNFTKWSNTLKQFVGNLSMNCLSVFDHFVGLVLKGLRTQSKTKQTRNQYSPKIYL